MKTSPAPRDESPYWLFLRCVSPKFDEGGRDEQVESHARVQQ